MRGLRGSTLALLLLRSGFTFGAQSDVEIQQKSIECWPIDEFLLVQSTFVPPGDIQTAKFYFRSTALPDYYYVELTLGASDGRAIAPKAHPQTTEVTFYTELVTRSFSAFRTDERTVPVASGSECKRRDPEAAFYTGQNPDIAVGATRLGATPLPPGFQADGIARFLSATGISGEAAAGGVSGKTLGIIAGGGGAGAAFLLLGGGSDATTTNPVGGITTSSPSSSSTSTAIGGVTSTTTTVGGGGSTSSTTTTVGGGGSTSSTTTTAGGTTTTIGSTTTVVGSSSTTSVGSSTTSIGSSTTTVGSSTTTAGTSSTTSSPTTTTSVSTTTTSASSTTTTAAGTTADLVLDKSASPAVVGVGGRILYVIIVQNKGPADSRGVIVSDTLPPGVRVIRTNPSCSGSTTRSCPLGTVTAGTQRRVEIEVVTETTGTKTNRATAAGRELDPNPSDNQDSVTTQVNLTTLELGAQALQFESELRLRQPNEGATGSIVLNDTTMLQIRSGPPSMQRLGAEPGVNRFEARIEPGIEAHGSWRFAFGGTGRLVEGSLRIEAGEILTLSSDAVVFSVRPGAGPIRFSLQLR